MLRRSAGVRDAGPTSWQKRAAPPGTIGDTIDARRLGQVQCESACRRLPQRDLRRGRLHPIQPEGEFGQVDQAVTVKIEEFAPPSVLSSKVTREKAILPRGTPSIDVKKILR
jgi:hypothetical protein